MVSMQEEFLRRAELAARAAGHIFPEYAACEAALESGWGQSRLATRANNLFGQKKSPSAIAVVETISLPTREYLHGKWVTVEAEWVSFVDWSGCFKARMKLLRTASGRYPHYARALVARTGEEFIREVSQSWSTDPQRAEKVLAIHAAHEACFRAHLLEV